MNTKEILYDKLHEILYELHNREEECANAIIKFLEDQKYVNFSLSKNQNIGTKIEEIFKASTKEAVKGHLEAGRTVTGILYNVNVSIVPRLKG